VPEHVGKYEDAQSPHATLGQHRLCREQLILLVPYCERAIYGLCLHREMLSGPTMCPHRPLGVRVSTGSVAAARVT
jgi:hypothetical protein